jgi:hypothetical protein
MADETIIRQSRQTYGRFIKLLQYSMVGVLVVVLLLWIWVL